MNLVHLNNFSNTNPKNRNILQNYFKLLDNILTKSSDVSILFLKRLSKLELTPTGYRNVDPHIDKIFKTMKALLDSGPSSKWDLATVSYTKTGRSELLQKNLDERKSQTRTKKGLTDYNWVLTHKLISEMLKLNLISKCGKSNKKNGPNKKHKVDLYYLTPKGLTLMILLDKSLYSHKCRGKLRYYKQFFQTFDDDVDNVLSGLITSIWSSEISPTTIIRLRSHIMMNIVQQSESDDILSTVVLALISFMTKYLEEKISDTITQKNNDNVANYKELISIWSIIHSINDKQVQRMMALGLIKKIAVTEFFLNSLKQIRDDMIGDNRDLINEKMKMQIALEQVLLKARTSSALSGASLNFIRPLDHVRKMMGIEKLD